LAAEDSWQRGAQKPSRGEPNRVQLRSLRPASVRVESLGEERDAQDRKEKIVAELTERLRDAETLIVADYRGLTMKEIDALRGKLLEHGARFTVVKNSLTRRAAEEAGAEGVLALLEGPTAIAFLESEGDPVAVAKALSDTAQTTRCSTARRRARGQGDVGRRGRGTAAAGRCASRSGARRDHSAALRDRRAVHGTAAGPAQPAPGRIDQLGGEEAEAEAEQEVPEPEAEPEAHAAAVVEAEPADEDTTDDDTTPAAEAEPAVDDDATEEAAEAVTEDKEEE
jgi:large subunit ribosomal protein L10